MRVVADTNTVLSGLLWSGNPANIIENARLGRVRLFTSAGLLDELERVLHRPKFSKRLGYAGLTAGAALALYRDLATVVVPAPLAVPSLRDPDDLAVLACAVGARADVIVSGDADLLDLRSFQTIEILGASQLVARTRTSPGQ